MSVFHLARFVWSVLHFLLTKSPGNISEHNFKKKPNNMNPLNVLFSLWKEHKSLRYGFQDAPIKYATKLFVYIFQIIFAGC